jgi:formylglycine-generating enzyme required for sulfatase activity
MFALVPSEFLYERPIPARNRIIFYIGHFEAFDWNLIADHTDNALERFAPDLDRLFAFGIDPPPGQLPADTPQDWPELAAVREYRDRVRDKIDLVWDSVPERLKRVAIEHRLMHAETLAYILHAAPPEHLVQPAREEPVLTSNDGRSSEWCGVPAGVAVLGRSRTGPFGWDNEFPEHEEHVEQFEIQRYKVTNGQYLRFVERGAKPPHFWCRGNDGEWRLRRMFDTVPLPLDWPVWVTHHEARAFAEFTGASLPTEAQWTRAAYGDNDCTYPWGNARPDDSRANVDARRFSPTPVESHPASASPCGVEDLLGNGWEWTATPFRPFPGFEAFPFYPNYSEPFFDEAHFVLKGASPRTDQVFLRRSFRNWFRPDYPYVFSGFRCSRPSR